MLTSQTVAKKKRVTEAPTVTQLNFADDQVFKIKIDRVSYFVKPILNCTRSVDVEIADAITKLKKCPEYKAITQRSFSIDNNLRLPVNVKFVGNFPKRMGSTMLISPYHLTHEASREELLKLLKDDITISHTLRKLAR